MPRCTAYPGPLSVLVMDNAKIHHDDAILELADRYGMCTIILPCLIPILFNMQGCELNTSHPTHLISTQSRRRSRKSSTSCDAIKIITSGPRERLGMV
jgi:hypothetical protein